jgi:guanylate kinase
MNGRLVILSGPSGVGKDTVLQAWRRVNHLVERVVATTTRAPRPGEADGVDYDFVSVIEFDQKVRMGEFLEHKLVHGNWYATPSGSVTKLLLAGKVAVLKIDVQGAIEVMAKRPDALSVFLLPPSWAVLEARIRARGTESEEVIAERLDNARFELSLADRYSHQVVNGDLCLAVEQLEAILQESG